MRAQANEDRDIREAIGREIVDGLEYVRTKEKIALTKQRVKKVSFIIILCLLIYITVQILEGSDDESDLESEKGASQNSQQKKSD